ncbi:hypothetical protein DXU04_04890 [Bradyrhizobium diazoefficiens]
MLDPVAVLDGLRRLELLYELLLPRQQVLYDRTHKSPIAPNRASRQKSGCGHWRRDRRGAREQSSRRCLHQNVRGGGWFLQMNRNAGPTEQSAPADRRQKLPCPSYERSVVRVLTAAGIGSAIAPSQSADAARATGVAELRATREPESSKTAQRSVVFAPPESYAYAPWTPRSSPPKSL